MRERHECLDGSVAQRQSRTGLWQVVRGPRGQAANTATDCEAATFADTRNRCEATERLAGDAA